MIPLFDGEPPCFKGGCNIQTPPNSPSKLPEPLDGFRMCHVRRLHGVTAVEGALIGHGFPRWRRGSRVFGPLEV